MNRIPSLLLLAALSLAACGGDDDSQTGSVTPGAGGSAGAGGASGSSGQSGSAGTSGVSGSSGQGGSAGSGPGCDLSVCCTTTGQFLSYPCTQPRPASCLPGPTPPTCGGGAGGSAGAGGEAGQGGAGAGGDAGAGGASGEGGAGAGGDAGAAGIAGAGAGGAGAGGEAGQGGAGASGSAGAGGGAGGPTKCGGALASKCGEQAFCNQDGHCGLGDQSGTCEATPQGCPEDCPGVCGCDGQKYCNQCDAHAKGVSVSSDVSCLTPFDCQAQASKLSGEFGIVGSCTGVVRLDYTTLKVLSYAVECGKYQPVTESSARQVAKSKTGYGEGSALISGANPEDEFVFYQAPSDIGNVAAVNARSGVAVFGGSIIGLGKGEISYPTEWRSPADIGSGCGGVTINQSRGLDLRDGKALDEASVKSAVAVVEQTALPLAMAQNSYVFDAMVLLYPRSVFAFDPATAEWVVLVNSGWLE